MAEEKKVSIETVVKLILILVFATIIIWVLINAGITSKLLGSMPWIESLAIGVFSLLGLKL